MLNRVRSIQPTISTISRGLDVLNSPSLNKGTAFSSEERITFGLIGLLPPEISTLEDQVKRAYIQYERLPDALGKNLYLTALHDRNQVLFYRLFSEHLRQMIPIVNDLTVGLAVQQHNHESRRPRGIYLSIDHEDAMEAAFHNFGAVSDQIDLILATDSEKIPGLGDWGIGGIEVAIGKLAIYTAAGGLNPARVIPVMLDVGTNQSILLNDPMYVGNRHPRVTGARYDAFIAHYVKVVTKLFPHALLQWEDFTPSNGRQILDTYRDRICTFNDDMQGTGAIALAAAISALRICASPIRNQRVVIFGAGTAGIGIAEQIRQAMMNDGLTKAQALKRFWCVDEGGLLTSDMDSKLFDYQSSYARPAAECKNWKHSGSNGGISLDEVVHRVKPTMLIGTSTVPGSFTEAIVRDMAANTQRPIIFALSNPHTQAEAIPSDLIAWTDGRALIATGSYFSPVTFKGVTYVVAQAINAMLYPGLALGTIVSRASRVSNQMLAAAASAVSSLVTVGQPGSSLLPHIDDLRTVSLTVATAVAEAAVADGLARIPLNDIVRDITNYMWVPDYPTLLSIQ